MSDSRKLLASGRLNLSLPVRLAFWALASILLSVIFFREFWLGLPGMLSLSQILGQNQASPWGVLVLCFIFLWLQRKRVRDGMQSGPDILFAPIGVAITVGAILLPVTQDYRAFQVLLSSLGVFVILFGKGTKIPFILLVIYGFTISFPLLVNRFAENAYAQTVIIPLTRVLAVLGYPFATEGQWLNLISAEGDLISVVVTVACAGPSTMGVFLSIFALMTLDMPLPPKKSALLFLFGVAGTWFQNLIRVVLLMVTGYYLGEKALWTAHYWTIYLLFPLWYLLFVYIYFRQFGSQKHIATALGTANQGVEV